LFRSRAPATPLRPRRSSWAAPPCRPAAPPQLRRDRRPILLRVLARFVLVPPAHHTEPRNPRLGTPASSAAARRRAPPSPTDCRSFGRLRKIPAVGLRSDAPVQSHRPHATAALGSRSNGSRSIRPCQLGQPPRQPWQFCRKAPEFPIFTEKPFHLRSFLTV
jgi:hypothetical protein